MSNNTNNYDLSPSDPEYRSITVMSNWEPVIKLIMLENRIAFRSCLHIPFGVINKTGYSNKKLSFNLAILIETAPNYPVFEEILLLIPSVPEAYAFKKGENLNEFLDDTCNKLSLKNYNKTLCIVVYSPFNSEKASIKSNSESLINTQKISNNTNLNLSLITLFASFLLNFGILLAST